MGIARGAYRLLLEEKKRGVLQGDTILQLGKQGVLFNTHTLKRYAALHNVSLEGNIPPQSGFIDDITLFKALGFKNVHSLDYSDFEKADILWDLNEPIDPKYYGQFDVIYDGGALEHVFNVPQVFKNIHHLLKENGLIIHVSPSHNHVDHGFYMFSPQLFNEYYTTNQYQIVTAQIFEYSPHFNRPWTLYQYGPGALDLLPSGGFGHKLLGIHFIAQKMAYSTAGVTPQQRSYVRAWNKHAPSPNGKRRINPVKRLGISLKKKVRRFTPLLLKKYWAKKKLKQVAKY